MTVQRNIQKIMVGCRMNPDLKELLDAEAAEKDMSLSAYLEALVVNRTHNSVDVEKLKEKIFELESTISEFQQQQAKMLDTNNSDFFDATEVSKELMEKGIENRMLKQDKAELIEKLRQALRERDVAMKMQGKSIPHWISDNGYKQLIELINKLKRHYPNQTYEELLLSSVELVNFNEKKPLFIIDTLSKLWKHQPHFITILKQKGVQQ